MRLYMYKNMSYIKLIQFEPGNKKILHIACAPNEDSDQPALPRSLTIVLVGHYVGCRGPKASTDRRLIRVFTYNRVGNDELLPINDLEFYIWLY